MFFFFKQKTAYEIMPSLVGSEMCIRDSLWRGSKDGFDLSPANGQGALGGIAFILAENAGAGKGEANVWHVLNHIVGDAVVAALGNVDAHGMPVNLSAMAYPVVGDLIIVVDVLGTGAITGEGDSMLAEVRKFVALDAVALTVEIESHTIAAAVKKFAAFDDTALRTMQANEPVGLVDQ
eukprot:TRINITY_DN30970_c0_g1_i2.p3 TRINITY_DN30970_c0_g1~~TRINITY_DN30970_c0_g1_i2.p3  ORF type:complete len:179 (-),score=22.02 TRINITY_DN30970_c0_g1_i2:450-986(-)